MRRYLKVCSCGAAVALLAALPAMGVPTFTYTTDFESDADGATPAGWVVSNSDDSSPLFAGPDLNPRVMAADPANWDSRSQLAAAGVVNYAVPWSGNGTTGHRFTILHPGWSAGDTTSWASGATFTGIGATYSGTYPMDLQANSFKAVYDVAIRTANRPTSTHGFVFTIQPVEDAQHVRIVGEAYGREGYDQNGFGVEVDVYTNTGGGGSGSGDQDNVHVGVNLYRLWDIAGSFSSLGITVPSLKTNVDQGVTVPFPAVPGLSGQSAWCSVGNNNQPLHFTVYYNDPDKGGLGVVRVYLKVDPATKDAGDPAVPAGQTPFSFGYDTGDDPVDGKLMIETCVGAWPASGAAFGFVAARSGSSHISQVDNVHVETNAVESGTPCTVTYPSGPPAFDPGTATATLPVSERVQTGTAGLTRAGWDVSSYLMSYTDPGGTLPTRLDVFKGSIRSQRDSGFVLGTAVAEPDLNYWTAGGGGGGLVGNIGDNRLPPGVSANFTWVGILAKGWIYFPLGSHDYDLCMNSDNGYEIRIGTQILSKSDQDGTFSSGLNGGSHFTLHVDEAGVYPIQVLWFDYGGGAYCELYRRTDTPMAPFLLLGSTTWGIADQPVIFGLRNGSPAPDYVSTYPPTPPVLPAVTLAAPMFGDVNAVTGQSSGFNIKTVWVRYPGGFSNTATPPIEIYQNGGDGDPGQTALGFLDALDNMAPGATSDVVNFRGPGESDGAIANGSDFPGIVPGASAGQFALRAEGYAVFPAAGQYILGLESDDDMHLRFGDQTVITSTCCRNLLVALDVPAPGTWPVRVEFIGRGSPNHVDLYQLVPVAGSHAYVPVNSPSSTVKVYQSTTTGAYPWTTQTNKWNIPAARKVANLTDVQDADLGWNATLIKSAVTTDNNMGLTAALVRGDLVGLDSSAYPRATDSPLYINYADNGQAPQGNFNTDALAPAGQQTADRLINNFLSGGTPLLTADDNDNYVMSFQGYIAFPVAGYYAFNTNTDEGTTVWIAGKPAAYFNVNSGPGDNTPGFIYIEQPGVYDVRLDYFEGGSGSEVEFVQYLPDGTTAALINDPNANTNPKRVKVYRALKPGVTPLTTYWTEPGQIPASLKAGEIDRAGDPGFHLQFVNVTYLVGNYEYGVGHDKFRTVFEAHELLAAVLDGVPSHNQHGVVAVDGIFQTVNFPDASFPPGVNAESFAMRATGLLALTAGGHIFEVASDDGFRIWFGDKTPGESGAIHGVYNVTFYINAPADGLYPFTLEYEQGYGGYSVAFNEVLPNATAGFDRVPVNTGNAAKVYQNLALCSPVWVDTDNDQDVDQDDFGVFQACFTGSGYAGPAINWPCKCFDKIGAGADDGSIDATDLNSFMNCWTGPTVRMIPIRPGC